MNIQQISKVLIAVVALTGAAAFAASPPAEKAPPPGSSTDYIIGPGDTIQIFVWRNAELSASVPVRPDGKISTPLVEDVVAVGKTPSQLARDIETRLAEYIRSPKVNVIVTGAQSMFSQITVIGKVNNPRSVPYRDGMTLLDVVLAAGGLNEFAAGNRAKLLRKDASGKTVERRVHLTDLVKSGKLKENMNVLPGDVLLVPESRF